MRAWMAAAAAVGLALSGAAGAQQKTTVVLGVSGRPDQAGLELALDRGYFARQGLDIKTVQATGGPEFVSALAADQIQVASGAANPGLFNALKRGIDIRIVADFAHLGDATDRTLSLMVRQDLIDSGAVKSPADLKGRSLSNGPSGAGQLSDVLSTRIFDPVGLSLRDFQVVYINFSDLMAAFASKAVDSGFQIEPLVTAAEERHIARVLVPGGAIYPGGELSVVYYSSAFAQKTDAATRFMVAYLEGMRDYYDAFFLGKNKDETIALLIDHLPLKDPKIWAISRQFTDLNGAVNVADLKFQAGVYKRLGMISGEIPDIDKFIDPQFAAAAVKALGAR
jgi:NitT/TauT family transport system substrate-binding protein